MKLNHCAKYLVCVLSVFFLFGVSGNQAQAADMKVGVINMQKVLAGSNAGKKAEAALGGKMEELKVKFKKDEDALIALQKEIEKKSSAWSDEMKQEKGIEFQRMRRDLRVKQEDANLELKKMREEKVGPILKELQGVVKKYAEKNDYTVVLPNNVILFAGAGVDITESITKELNKVMK